MNMFPRLPLAALALLGLFASLSGQTYEQVAPKIPDTGTAVSALPEPAAPVPTGGESENQVFVPHLRGLSFLAERESFHREGIAVEGLQISGLPLLDTAEFRALATPYLGHPLSRSALNALTRAVVLYCRGHDRPVVDVFVPEQAVSTGTLQVIVVEGRLGAVRTEGNRWFADDLITSAVRAQPGEVLTSRALLADLEWINRNPFRQTDLVFSRGREPGETDLVLRTKDRFPLRVYAGYEDSGNALTGFDRVLAGVNWGHAFGRDEQLNYQVSASPDLKTFVAHAGSYVVPLPRWRHTLTVFGSLADSQPALEGGLFDLEGRTWQLSARYRMPLPDRAGWNSSLTAGLDFKRSNNDLSFGGTQIFARENDVVQALATLGVNRVDARGATSAEFTLVLSPGGLTSGNHTSAYQDARSGAQPDYGYARLDVERTTKLPAGLSWIARGTAQLASANLLGSEQLGLGGSGSLRGYEEREANGDDGFGLVNELHGPVLQLTPHLARNAPADRLDPFVFFDYGLVASHDRLPGEAKRLTLASAGLGFRYRLGSFLSVRADYGWQLKDSGVSDGRRSERGHVSVVLAY